MNRKTVKRFTKLGLSRIVSGLGGNKILKRKNPLILMYHRVLPRHESEKTWSSPAIVTSLESFAAQMDCLARNYHIFSPSELSETGNLPPGSVAVTFDDGWADNHQHALPILQKYGIKAAFFLTAGLINTEEVFFPEKLRFYLHLAKQSGTWNTAGGQAFLTEVRKSIGMNAPFPDPELLARKLWMMDQTEAESFLSELHRLLGHPEIDLPAHRLMNWEEVRVLKQAGMELGSHGLNHVRLPGLADPELFLELSRSKELIETATGVKVSGFAYPKGDHHDRIRQAAGEAGYNWACDTREGFVDRKSDLMALPRLNVCESRFSDHRGRFSPDVFRAALGGLF